MQFNAAFLLPFRSKCIKLKAYELNTVSKARSGGLIIYALYRNTSKRYSITYYKQW